MSSIKVTSLSVKNYRSFGERQDFVFPNGEYTKPIAIIGYNNAGKTNLLNALKYSLYESIREETLDINDFHHCVWENFPCFSSSFSIDIQDDKFQAGHVYSNIVLLNINNKSISSVTDYCSCYQEPYRYSKKWAIKQKAPIYYINFHNIKDEISTQKTSWGNLKSFLAKHIQKLVDLDQVMKDKKDAFKDGVKRSTDDVLANSQLKNFIEAIQKNYKTNLRDCRFRIT